MNDTLGNRQALVGELWRCGCHRHPHHLILLAAWVLVAVLQRAIRTMRERIAAGWTTARPPSAPKPWAACSATWWRWWSA
jgi:hypothetical protein